MSVWVCVKKRGEEKMKKHISTYMSRLMTVGVAGLMALIVVSCTGCVSRTVEVVPVPVGGGGSSVARSSSGGTKSAARSGDNDRDDGRKSGGSKDND